NINYLNQYYFFIANNSHNWKEYLTSIKTQYQQRFFLPVRPLYDPKLIISKQFTNYFILSPNTRQEIDLDLYFNKTRSYYTKDGLLFNYHYSETEFYDAGYSILSYPFYRKNFVTKYLKNDTILSNAHIEHLKTNINSINFQKQQESITLARAYQDRYLGWINSGLNLLTLGFQYKTNNSLPNPVYNAIGTNILAQNAFYAANSIINTTINANRGIEDSKRAITKWYATQNDLYLQNKVDQNILGIESLLELKDESCSLYYQSLSENELKKANYFF
ncbi:hypothetical protein B5M19_04020, partial [Mesomycoplasma hyopneumoniae]|uniref:hypothetical protein n=1 Tax=Mesomycoplasma hyopneumoniae TaxID=2099 RepID=UPI000B701FA7